MKAELLKKIEKKEIEVGVVGLGYVGLPLAVEKAKAGFKTIGFDVQEEKVNLVNQGHNYIGDVVDSDLKELVEKGMLKATTDFSFVKDVDFIAICVPSPQSIKRLLPLYLVIHDVSHLPGNGSIPLVPNKQTSNRSFLLSLFRDCHF